MNRTVAGTLRAYDPLDLSKELWTSDMDPWGQDKLGMLAKFSPPVVANGKVYVGTFSRELAVYGLLNEARLYRVDLGSFQLQPIGDVIKTATYKGGKYDFRLSGAGIGGNIEGYLLAYCDRDPNDSAVTIEATILGINAPDYRAASAGVIVRRGLDGQTGMAALMLQGSNVRLIIREEGVQAGTLATELGRVTALAAPVRLRLTLRGIEEKPGQVLVTGEIVDLKTGETVQVGDPFALTLDSSATMDIKVGIFASAEVAHKVEETAFPAWARFDKVQV